MLKKSIFIFTFIFLSLVTHHFKSFAAVSIDLNDSDNYNIRFDGAAAGNTLSDAVLIAEDLNGDDKIDLVLGENKASLAGFQTGSIYILYYDLWTSLEPDSPIDLLDTDNFNIRIDGYIAGEEIGTRPPQVKQLNGTGNLDLIISNLEGQNEDGSIWILYDTILDDYTGTGNIIDLEDSSSFNIRYDGANNDNLGSGGLVVEDFNNNGSADLLMGAGGGGAGIEFGHAIYMVYDNLIDDYSGTGNIVSLGTSSNYNIKWVSPEEAWDLSGSLIQSGDWDGDDKPDFVIGSTHSDYNSLLESGSVWVFFNTIIDDYSGTGNSVDLSVGTNYSIRYDGPTGYVEEDDISGSLLGYGGNAVDYDSDGDDDLLLGAATNTPDGVDDAGSIYLINHDLLSAYAGTTDNQILLSTASAYNIRIDGAHASAAIGQFHTHPTGDFNNNGVNDLFLGTPSTDFSGRTDAGTLYVIYDTILDDYSGTGNELDLSDSDNYSLIYGGAGATHRLTNDALAIADLNDDGMLDILAGAFQADYNSRNNSGSAYIIYNFPHTISADQSSLSLGQTSITLTGAVTATNSTTNISGVQSRANSGSWEECDADDGDFDSTSESYTCNVTLESEINQIDVRAYDTNGVYTNSANYVTVAAPNTDTDDDSSSDEDRPSCDETPPGSSPHIYSAIAQSPTSILLQFEPAKDPVEHYALEFGTKSGDYTWGAITIGDRDTRSYLATSLTPNINYYFRIRAGNECAAGDWSEEIVAATESQYIQGAFAIPEETTKPVSKDVDESAPSELTEYKGYEEDYTINEASKQENSFPYFFVFIAAGGMTLITVVIVTVRHIRNS